MSHLETDAAGRSQVDGATAAFGLAAAIAILFNTLLAWVKDAYDPLNTFMAHLTGHHWRTHGIVDVVVFLVLGFFFLSRGVKVDGVRLATYLVGSCIIAGGGLALWFVLV